MIVTGSPDVAALCRSIRTHGRRDGALYFDFDRIGFNSKMNDLEAAVGLEGLEAFDETFAIRRRHWARLHEMLRDLEERLMLYPDGPGETVAPHAFPLVLRDAERIDGLYAHLERHGIQCKTLFGSLPTQHRAFRFLGYREGDFPVAERIGRSGLHFGLHQYLTDADVEFIADTVSRHFALTRSA